MARLGVVTCAVVPALAFAGLFSTASAAAADPSATAAPSSATSPSGVNSSTASATPVGATPTAGPTSVDPSAVPAPTGVPTPVGPTSNPPTVMASSAVTPTATEAATSSLPRAAADGTYRIGDLVWYDLDENGVHDAGEPGVPGVTVDLEDEESSILQTTKSDSQGAYAFDHLEAGTYRLAFGLLPPGAIYTDPLVGGDPARDSDCQHVSGLTPTFRLDADRPEELTMDCGLIPAEYTVGDLVWSDLDRDGLQDADEPGVAGVTATVLAADGSVVGTATSDENGRYLVREIRAGRYRVRFSGLPAGTVFTQRLTGHPFLGSDPDPASGVTAPFDLAGADLDEGHVDAGVVPAPPPGDGPPGDGSPGDDGLADTGGPGLGLPVAGALLVLLGLAVVEVRRVRRPLR